VRPIRRRSSGAGVALLCGAAPGAAASYLLARQMGGDAPLMAGVVALTTVVSALSIPILLALFASSETCLSLGP
jgi:predicted permease